MFDERCENRSGKWPPFQSCWIPRMRRRPVEAIRKLVESPEFRAAKERASRAAREAKRRLDSPHRGKFSPPSSGQAHHKLPLANHSPVQARGRGGDFDERQTDVRDGVERARRGRRGAVSRADPNFNHHRAPPRVRRAPLSISTRILFDEAPTSNCSHRRPGGTSLLPI